MRHHIRTLLARHETGGHVFVHLKSGSGAVVGIGFVTLLSSAIGLPLLVAPLGATAVLIFGQPSSPLAQPANVFGGYLVSCLVAACIVVSLPDMWWSAALAVGLAVALMASLRVTHPPAGAIPLIASTSAVDQVGVFMVVLLGSISLVLVGLLHHRIPPRQQYPRRGE